MVKTSHGKLPQNIGFAMDGKMPSIENWIYP
jgi:hypothetical protein